MIREGSSVRMVPGAPGRAHGPGAEFRHPEVVIGHGDFESQESDEALNSLVKARCKSVLVLRRCCLAPHPDPLPVVPNRVLGIH